ncbi:hypothetical protein [Magnetospirillum sulfuroxidans]|uniref:Flagellin N-terminal domain-containing protein n=1 Tax=Magnetospirillum sulfuroxidans TaxID=611300 RepID=A0ABS5IEN7_9PROT|nr:hypothetical protein [Magnetospirillum sulfuroxidans]MBR9972877.1 hypothetical protein [Magnetospirillum sulfuroxidans]
MEAVSRSVGRLDDLYAVTQVTGAAFRRFGQVANSAAGQTGSSSRNFTLAEGRLAAQAAVSGAGTILDSLYALRGKLDVADGLSIPSQRTDATRFSVQSDIGRLIAGIDQTVAQSAVGGLNLISDPSSTVRIQTSTLGGVVTIATQPLDSESLGLSGLSVADQTATEAAKVAVDAAIQQVSARYDVLATAAQGLSYNKGISEGLVQALSSLSQSGGKSSALARGSLVNLRT